MGRIYGWYKENIGEGDKTTRWGAFSFGISFSFFFLALCANLLAIYLTITEGKLMPPVGVIGWFLLVMIFLTGLVGLIVGVGAFIQGIIWLRHSLHDTTESRLVNIESDMVKIKKKLGIVDN